MEFQEFALADGFDKLGVPGDVAQGKAVTDAQYVYQGLLGAGKREREREVLLSNWIRQTFPITNRRSGTNV